MNILNYLQYLLNFIFTSQAFPFLDILILSVCFLLLWKLYITPLSSSFTHTLIIGVGSVLIRPIPVSSFGKIFINTPFHNEF